MADKTKTPKKVVVESSKCFVGSSPSGTNEIVFIFGNSRLILIKSVDGLDGPTRLLQFANT